MKFFYKKVFGNRNVSLIFQNIEELQKCKNNKKNFMNLKNVWICLILQKILQKFDGHL